MNKRNTITLLLIVVLLGVCDFSAYQIYKILDDYSSSTNEYKALEEEYVVINSTEDEVSPEVFSVDFQGLKERNSDFQGWLYAEGLEVSLPVMMTDDNDYYLHRTFEKEYRFAGSLFIDCRFNGFDDPYLIIYGHLMKDGSMFAKIPKYRDKDHYLQYPTFTIYEEGKNCTYEIFSFFQTDTQSEVYEFYSQSDEIEEQFYHLKENSYYDTGIEYQPDDHIIILSTCVNTEGEERWVLCARLSSTEAAH